MFDPLLPSAVTFGATLGYSLKLVRSVGLHRESTALVCLLWYWKNKPVQPVLWSQSSLWLPIWGGKEGQAGVQKLHKGANISSLPLALELMLCKELLRGES